VMFCGEREVLLMEANNCWDSLEKGEDRWAQLEDINNQLMKLESLDFISPRKSV